MTRDKNGLELSWETQGDYAFAYQKVQVRLHGARLQQVWVDGTGLVCQEQQIECCPFQRLRLNFLLANTSKT